MVKIEVIKKEPAKDAKGRASKRFTHVHVKVGNRKVVVAVPTKIAQNDKKLSGVLAFSVGGLGKKEAKEERERLRSLIPPSKKKKKKGK